MGNRTDLQTILESILGSRNVYYQPPENLKLKYPAIIYNRFHIESKHADNNKYLLNRQYSIILVDYNPDSIYIDKILKLQNCKYDNHYVSDGLYHDVFSIFY